MAHGVPAFEIVAGTKEDVVPCRHIGGLALHSTGQPVTDGPEVEHARYVASFYGAISIGEDGTTGSEASGPVGLVKTGGSAGVVVFTDSRAIGAFGLGEFVGMTFDHDRSGQALMMSLDYANLDSLELVSTKKLLGGRKPIGFQLSVVEPAVAGLHLEIVGETTLDLRGSRVPDLSSRFDRLVQTVCDRLLATAGDGTANHLRRVRAGGYERSKDGDPVAVLRPET